MRVLFIVPHFADIYGPYKRLYKKGFVNPPLSLCYLAAAVENNGHQVKIIDGEARNLSIRDILDETKRYQPDMLGITATSVDFSQAEKLIKHLKEAFPDVPIILGGTHINIFGKEVLKDTPEVDFGCIGDGEDLIQELLRVLPNDKTSELEKIAGLIFRENGNLIQNSLRPPEKIIDKYSFPARHLLKNNLYYRAIPNKGYQTTAAFMSSRGCPYSCVYCAVNEIYGGSKVRFRSAENVLEELDYIVSVLGIKHVAFNDDCLTLRKDRIYEICDGIQRRGLNFSWEGLSRADTVDKKLLTNMKKAGFIRISYGIESGNPEILKVIQKNETLDQIEEAFRITHEVGIVARGSVLIGCPYETKKTVMQTLNFIRNLKGLDQVVINILQPYPGTKVREMVMNEEGGAKFYTNKTEYNKLQRFGSASISVNDLKPNDLILLQKWGYLTFYLRPKVIWNNLKIAGLKTFLLDGVNFIRSILGL